MNKYVKRSSGIELADTYTPLPKPEERFEPSCYAWLTAPKAEPLHRQNLLPAGDREELLKLWEQTDKQISSQRYPDQEGFKCAEKQMGNVMHSSELIRRIRKLNANLIVEDSVALKGNASFYWTDGKEKKYTNASFTKGWIPEFTIIHVDTADLPAKYPTYGWRTVLVRLLKFGAITWQNVLDVFGEVHHSDHRGKHWAHNVAAFR